MFYVFGVAMELKTILRIDFNIRDVKLYTPPSMMEQTRLVADKTGSVLDTTDVVPSGNK